MSKSFFRPYQYVNLTEKVVVLKPPYEPPPVQEEKVEEIYEGPTIEDIRREAEEFKQAWEAERAMMIQEAQLEADSIRKAAEDAAFERVKKENDAAAKIRIEAERERERMLELARREAAEIRRQTEEELAQITEEARQKGYKAGYESGWQEGKVEVERLVSRIHVIIERLIQKRNEIIEGAETQLINLVLLMVKKVVKVISENQKNVVISNVIQALRKLKSRGDVVIRVNLEDVQLATEHTKEFIRMIENIRSVSIVEDTTVDKGGCVIETDFGEIDARISSQLHEIEEKILELMPIKVKLNSDEKEKVERP